MGDYIASACAVRVYRYERGERDQRARAVWKASEKDAQVPMDDWSLRYLTNTEDVARVLVDIAPRYLVAGEARVAMPRTLQFSSEDRCTRYQMCQLFAEIMGLPLRGLNGIGDDKKAAVPRPCDTHWSNQGAERAEWGCVDGGFE